MPKYGPRPPPPESLFIHHSRSSFNIIRRYIIYAVQSALINDLRIIKLYIKFDAYLASNSSTIINNYVFQRLISVHNSHFHRFRLVYFATDVTVSIKKCHAAFIGKKIHISMQFYTCISNYTILMKPRVEHRFYAGTTSLFHILNKVSFRRYIRPCHTKPFSPKNKFHYYRSNHTNMDSRY